MEINCPRCAIALVSPGGGPPWCPACEWNLDAYDERRPPELGWRWLDRRAHRLAYRLTMARHAELHADPARPMPGGGRTRVVLLVASVLLLAVIAGIVVLGAWIVIATWLSLATVFGVLLLLIAYAVRPRLGRLDRDADRLDEMTAPTLFALLRRVADATGAPMPDVVEVDAVLNASAATIGLRRTRVLRLGLPLWAVLTPQERVALLGHELGHFVNGDTRRGALTGVATRTFGELALLLRPGPPAGDTLVMMIADLITRAILRVLCTGAVAVHVLLVWLSMRDGQHAEYLADDLAARAAGTTAAVSFLDLLCRAETLDMIVRRDARAGLEPPLWRASVDELRAADPVVRQRAIRQEVSMFAGHPPSGLRARLIEARAPHAPAVVLAESDDASIDAELAKRYAVARREIAIGG
ncbi:M48 family metallopeptidase [Catenuloplanes japonicus]|uniref:M48 family metallopeptidase n=1 Tax=Catenuloplanes japonicus TaxID=33876 RepID=UPI000525289F|nr:M48 family metallopeptidase [Catenuloplanes japonicus]